MRSRAENCGPLCRGKDCSSCRQKREEERRATPTAEVERLSERALQASVLDHERIVRASLPRIPEDVLRWWLK